VLAGYARHALRGASYPGILPDASAAVAGVLVRFRNAQETSR
jgi:hypothetical protein